MKIPDFVISVLLYVLIAEPVCLLLHELGHATMALALTRQAITFQFGTRGPRRDFHLGRLTLRVYFEPAMFLGSRYYIDRSEMTRSQVFWTLSGGPLASLGFTLLCGGLWWATDGADPWVGLTVINLGNFLWTSIPWHYPKWQGAQAGIPNDALQLLYHLQQGREKAAHITGVTFAPAQLGAGEVLTVSITVTNNTSATLQTQGPDPGFIYTEGESFLSRGYPETKGAFRAGVDFDGHTGLDYPYRWGLGAPLAPGQTATVTGAIRLQEGGSRSYWAGLVCELVVWQQEFAGKQSVHVSPRED